MPEALCLGELLIDFVPTVTPVDLIDALAFQKAPGGAPANVAVGLARLGVSVGFLGKVGDDPFGHFLAKTLADAGVDVSQLHHAAEARTALAFVSLGPGGEREFLFYRHPSADMLHRPDEIDADQVRAAALLHFGSISLITEPARSATLHAVQCARAAGRMVSYDPNLRLALWPSAEAARAGMLTGWPEAEVIKLSTEELEFLTGEADPERAARQLWHERLRLLVITRGAAGCRYLTPDFAGDVEGFVVEPVDTTGAGDGFMAGILAGLLRHPEALTDEPRLHSICRRANAVGALTTTERGAIPALPDLATLEVFLTDSAGPAGK
jgi:fructokinase